MKVFMNGKWVAARDAAISVFDHGLLYGDGVFEGIRAYNGRLFRLDEHIDRLFESARAILIQPPLSKDRVAKAVVETCRKNRIRDGYVRLVVTRGVGTLGLNPFQCSRPQLFVIAATIQLYPEELYRNGLSVVTAGTPRNLFESVHPRIKSLNYLNNIMAKIEAVNAGAMEAILLNSQGYVAEASADNVFVVKGGRLTTPPTWCGALRGITRDAVMELAAESGYGAAEDIVTRFDLYTADEVFLTGTAAEIIGVTKIDGRTIGDGRPGPVTGDLADRFHALARTTGTPISPQPAAPRTRSRKR